MVSRLAVVKVGTSSITTADGKLDEEEMRRLANQISAVLKGTDKIVLVTSGAVAAGIAELGVTPKPSHDIVFRQAAAAAGQSVLMAKYRELFKTHRVKVAQILLTAELLRGPHLLPNAEVQSFALRLGDRVSCPAPDTNLVQSTTCPREDRDNTRKTRSL